MRTSKARTGLSARLACHRRWSTYGKHSPSHTQGGSRMRESRTYGSVRGALSNERPYRERTVLLRLLTAGYGTKRRFALRRYVRYRWKGADIRGSEAIRVLTLNRHKQVSRSISLRCPSPSSCDDVLDCGASEANSCDGASSSPFLAVRRGRSGASSSRGCRSSTRLGSRRRIIH